MMFGSQKRFSVQAEVHKPAGRYVFGQICFWAGSKQIGDYDQTVLLRPVADFLRATIRYQSKRSDPALSCLSPEQILDNIYKALYGDRQVGPQADSEHARARYSKFCICPNGCEAFDGELAVLMEQDTEERFIWRDFADRSVNEIRLGANEYEACVRAFLEWVDPLTGHDPLRERLAGKVFVMVGEFSGPHKELEGLIHRFGGRIERQVTVRTSYVVVGRDTGRQLQKVTQAGSLGIPILSERELRELLPKVSGS
jgi:hypothetical protein